MALDCRTGQRLWTQPVDVAHTVVEPRGGQVHVLAAADLVLVCSAPSGGDHHLKEFEAGQFARRSITALDAATGAVRWAGGKNYINRPIVVGDLIFAEPWFYELRTGEPKTRPHPETGQLEPWCVRRGAGGACARPVLRPGCCSSARTPAQYDLTAAQALTRRGGQRWGCWINAIPAGGLLLVPEGSAECDCPYALQCTTVLCPR